MKLPRGAISQLYANYRHRSKKRYINFTITREEFEVLILEACYLCGGGPLSLITYGGRTFYYNGIDRIDNSQGYTWENSATCCNRCNSIKSHSDLETLKDHLPKMLKRIRKLA